MTLVTVDPWGLLPLWSTQYIGALFQFERLRQSQKFTIHLEERLAGVVNASTASFLSSLLIVMHQAVFCLDGNIVVSLTPQILTFFMAQPQYKQCV